MKVYTLSEWNNRKKKKDEVKESGELKVYSYNEWAEKKGVQPITSSKKDDDIAPVRKHGGTSGMLGEKKDSEERTWFNSGRFDDGYQFGDVTKTILGSVGDLVEDAGAGIMGMGEKALDAMMYAAPYFNQGQFYQNGGAYAPLEVQKMQNKAFEESKKGSAEFIKKDLYDEQKIAKAIISAPIRETTGFDIEEASVFGEKTDSLAQSGGQLLATAGLQAVGVPWFLTTGATSFGAEAENALNQGATMEEAGLSAAVSAGAEILTEKLSGGIKFGGKTLDDGLTKLLSEKISNKALHTMAKLGVDAAGEGSEEVISGILSNLGSSLYKEENIEELLTSEEAINEYIESFIGGAVLGGVSSGIGTVKDAVGTKTEFTENEQKVIDFEVEKRISERETDGKKLTQREISSIEEQVKKELDRGYISIDSIESALGGETYDIYKRVNEHTESLQKEYDELNKLKTGEMTGEQIDRKAEIKRILDDFKEKTISDRLKQKLHDDVYNIAKSDRLAESYNEERRKGEQYNDDPARYKSESAQQTVQNVINSGLVQNTNRAHDFIDFMARISEDKGYVFDVTTSERLAESVKNGNPYNLEADPEKIQAFVSGKDKKIFVNLDANKSLNSLVGHEITHTLEANDGYEGFQKVLFDYAATKGELKDRIASLKKRYDGLDADTKMELTAELVGDYLFTDSDFIRELSVKDRNIFQKIYDEIKYLCKLATAGSREARELEKVKKEFAKLYRESADAKNDSKAQYNVSEDAGLYQYIQDALSGNLPKKSFYKISNTISDRMAKDIEDIVGFSVKDYGNEISPGSIRHINNDHGENGKSDHSMKDIHDLAKISYVIDNYDNIREGKRSTEFRNGDRSFAKTVELQKKIGEGFYYVVESVPDAKNKTLHVVSAYINKKDAFSEELVSNDPKRYVQDEHQPNASFENSIPQNSENSSGIAKETKYSISDSDGNELSKKEVKVMDGGSVVKYSLSTWTPETQTKVRNNLVKAGYEADRVDKWIADTNSVASVIAADKDRLDFEAADNQTMLKNNQEYVKTLDASTLCAKRLLYQGTFDAIQHRMPNTVLSSDDLISLLNMMKEHGHETPCGVCYVESRRRHLGKFANEWLSGYEGEYKPNLDEVTTSDGLEALRKSHPDTYKDFIDAMNKKGSSNPKVVQLRTEYRNEIMSLTPAQIKKIEAIGGLRVQSFSDFETPHLLDMMQAVMDMSAKGLSSQAYTKVPNFAWVFGDTGIKINLSLIADGDGFDADGNLAFSSVEGMDFNKAMELRNAYSDNVGTIIVGANDKHILACMADDRIDYIIPFHRSGWGSKELEMMGMSSYKDYTYGQNEHSLETGKNVPNLYPPDYWNYNISGKENAERYLNLCAQTGREPKFSNFLVNNGDGSYSLQPDGSTDGYWKTLIDFKMYNNEGKGVAQQKVQPNFNMEEAYRVLNEYEGGANKLPVAKDIVEEFVAKYQGENLGPVYSVSDSNRRKYGNYNVYGKDIRFEAPVKGTETETQIPAESFKMVDDYGPITEMEANELARRQEEEHYFLDEMAPEAEELYNGEFAEYVPAETAPTAEYEAIRPKPERTAKEPRMARVKEDGTPKAAPGKKLRSWPTTSTESEAVEGKVVLDDLDQDVIHYQPISNQKTLGNANAKLGSMGYETSVQYFNSQFENRRVTLDDVALGERLIQEAVKNGDYKTACDLIQNVSILGTELGQKVQALSIIKRLTPEGQLQMFQKVVKRGKAKGDKAYDGVEITQEMIDYILSTYGKDGSYDQNKLNEAVEKVKKQIADQMQVSKLDKVNAWRYLSMLGNPKTHIRNLVSNVAMRGTVAAKNAVARTIETVAPVKERTKTWKASTDAVKKFADTTTTEMKDVITGDSKYSNDATIKQKREIFKNKILNGVYKFNSDMLEKEDWWFSKPAFKNSLAEYLTANGIKTEQDIKNNPEVVEKAKNYALEQSQIATFRQYSWLANKIQDIERHNTATNIAVGAILPFKKTPINVAKAGLNYSPLGFMKTLTYDVAEVKKGNMQSSELVDHLAQNITGSALALAGYMLASSGFLSGGGDDDKEGKYDYQLGTQAYAINIDGKSYSLSWLSPVAMPLFVGANAYEQLVEGKEWNGDVVVETLAQTLDPLSEMSFLSSLDDVLSSYDSGIQKFAGIAESAAQNYLTQFVPTLSSQVATVMDDKKRSTKVAGDSEFKFVDETINKLIYKIPGLRETLEPSTDIWGNEVKQTENVFARALETFIAPYSKRDDIATEIDSELKAVYGETGENSIIPSVPYNYTNYDGVKYEMSAKEYTDFKKLYGQTANNLLGDLFDTRTYQAAGADEKADFIGEVYDYARDEAKRKLLKKHGVEYTNATKEGKEYYKENPIKGAIEKDLPLDEYKFSIEYPEKYAVSKAVGGYDAYKQYSKELNEIESDKDSNGKTINGSAKRKKTEYINSLDIDYGQKIILYRSLFYSAADKEAYDADIVEYLNSRSDLSNEDIVTILEELDMKVLPDGTVIW